MMNKIEQNFEKLFIKILTAESTEARVVVFDSIYKAEPRENADKAFDILLSLLETGQQRFKDKCNEVYQDNILPEDSSGLEQLYTFETQDIFGIFTPEGTSPVTESLLIMLSNDFYRFIRSRTQDREKENKFKPFMNSALFVEINHTPENGNLEDKTTSSTSATNSSYLRSLSSPPFSSTLKSTTGPLFLQQDPSKIIADKEPTSEEPKTFAELFKNNSLPIYINILRQFHYNGLLTGVDGKERKRRLEPVLDEDGKWVGRPGDKSKTILAAWIMRLEDKDIITRLANRKHLIHLLNVYFPNIKLGAKTSIFNKAPDAELRLAFNTLIP